MKETDFAHKFINEYLYKLYPFMYAIKIHGHEAQEEGIPDNLFCLDSIFVGIEFKVRRDNRITTTPFQLKHINRIKTSGGVGIIVAYDENNDKILIRHNKLDYRKIFLSERAKTVGVKTKSIIIDWDFEFNTYEDAVKMIQIMVNTRSEI